MVHKIGYIQRKSATISPIRQEQELLDYGVSEANIHTTLEGITRPGEFHQPGDVLVIWDIAVIGKRDINAVLTNIASGGSKGIYSIKDKRLYRVKNPATQDMADMMASLNGTEYKVRSKAGKGKSGAKKKLTPDQIDRARDLKDADMHIDDIAVKFEVSASTIRRRLDEGKE